MLKNIDQNLPCVCKICPFQINYLKINCSSSYNVTQFSPTWLNSLYDKILTKSCNRSLYTIILRVFAIPLVRGFDYPSIYPCY